MTPRQRAVQTPSRGQLQGRSSARVADVVDFPHQQPASPRPALMDPEQAAVAGELLGAATVVPMHYGRYALDPYYRPIPDALERFECAARGRPYRAAPTAPGEQL